LGAPPPPPRPRPCGGFALLPPGRGSAAAPRPARRFLLPWSRASARDRPDRDAATGTGTTRQSLARQRRHAHSALTRPDQGHGGGTQADTVSAWLILSDCRAPFVSRHACPLNRVKINVCPRYEGKPTPASGPCLGARCAGDHRRWPTTVSATSEYPPIWSAIPVRWVGVVMAPNSHSVCERLPLLVVVLGGGVR